jgi:exosortase C (VPDSG-CTERM-specific)
VEPLVVPEGESAGAANNRVSATAEVRTSSTPLHRRLLAFSLFAAGLVAAFAGVLVSLIIHAGRSELHSHIILIPFVSAYLIYIRRRELPNEYHFSRGWATIALLAGLVALIAAFAIAVFRLALSHNDYLALMTLSFVCLLTAGGILCLGGEWMTAAAFPFAFLLFMVPMPDAMTDALETASKLASTEAANLFFNMSGTPVFRTGAIFQLPTITIVVAQECSGIRSSWVLFITSLLAANLFLKSTWRRLLLVCFVIPLGVLRNGFRVWVIGMLCIHIGPQMIHSVIHRRGGPLFFALSLIPLFLLLVWLRRQETGMAQKSEALITKGARPSGLQEL